MPKLYYALSEIAAMRESLDEVRGELAPRDAERLLGKLELVERAALHMLDAVESRMTITAH